MNVRWYYINKHGKAHAFEVIGYIATAAAHSSGPPVLAPTSLCDRDFSNFGIVAHPNQEKCCVYCWNILHEKQQ